MCDPAHSELLCLNNGTCISQNNVLSCLCDDRFKGQRCEKGKGSHKVIIVSMHSSFLFSKTRSPFDFYRMVAHHEPPLDDS